MNYYEGSTLHSMLISLIILLYVIQLRWSLGLNKMRSRLLLFPKLIADLNLLGIQHDIPTVAKNDHL